MSDPRIQAAWRLWPTRRLGTGMLAIALVVASGAVFARPVAAAKADNYQTVVLNDKPSVYYRLDEPAGPTTFDTSPHRRNGVYGAGASFGTRGALSGSADTAITVNGSQAVSYGGSGLPSGNSARSVEFFFRTTMTSFFQDGNDFVDYGNNSYLQSFGVAIDSPHEIRVFTFANDAFFQTNSPVAITLNDDNWHHVVATWDGALNVSLYLDSLLVGRQSFPNSSALNTGAANFSIGSYLDCTTCNTYTGDIDEVAVYPTALTPAQVAAHYAAANPTGAGNAANLIYRGGTVETSTRNYVIFWDPPCTTSCVSPVYNNLIAQYLTDAPATPEYSMVGQYYQVSGGTAQYIRPDSQVVQTVVDSDTYPNTLLTSTDVTNEIRFEMGQHGWTASPSNNFFLVMAPGATVCQTLQGCSTSNFCAYHDSFSAPSGTVQYAIMPHPESEGSHCQGNIGPNITVDPFVDASITATAHELFEMITDPLGTGWCDRTGDVGPAHCIPLAPPGAEIGDKCVDQFLSTYDATTQSNVTVNGHHYLVQELWNNHLGDCSQSYEGP